MKRRHLTTLATALLIGACVRPTQFDRYIADGQWADAARELAADPALLDTERGLYKAAILYGTPGRPTYDPVKSSEYLTRFLMRYPGSAYRDDVTARLLLLEELSRTRREAEQREHSLEAQIAQLTRESRDLRARADSLASQGDSSRAAVTRLEADRRDREEQLRLLRLELQRLKEIDLKPRTPVRPPKP